MGFAASTLELKTMTDFRPFQAWRYSPKKVKPSEVIAPPYDVMTSESREKLYARSPYNCVRLDFNRPEAGDHDKNNPYTRARDFFKKWQTEGVLIQDDIPSFYLYRQGFQDSVDDLRKTRTALFGRLRLESFESGIVIPHEKTLAKPKEDRRRLLETTRANFSPVFGLAEDLTGILPAAGKKIGEAVDDEGVSHELRMIQEAAEVEAIREGLAEKKIYIADGHHRYQTALDYARDMRAELGLSEDEEGPFDFVLTALVAFEDPGLVLLPTHRIVLPFENWNTIKMLAALADYFKVEKGQRGGIILHLNKESYSLTPLNESKIRQVMPAGKPEIWYSLDVNLVGHLILEKLWHLPAPRWESVLRFTQSEKDAYEKVNGGQAAAAFILKAPPVTVLREMGEARELMPQKSTYFYPKLASGLAFYSHEGG